MCRNNSPRVYESFEFFPERGRVGGGQAAVCFVNQMKKVLGLKIPVAWKLSLPNEVAISSAR